MTLFLDANILFAAAITPKGRAGTLFMLADAGVCELLSSPYAAQEARRNVAAKYPHAYEHLETCLGILRLTSEAPAKLLSEFQVLPLKDAPILAAAVAAQADLLVTEDRKHFGKLYGKTFQKTRVVSLAEALALVTVF